MDNELLIRRAAKGDTAAFEQLVTPHEAMVWRACYHYMGNTEDAKDAAQETMLKAWRSIGGYRGETSISSWLYRIAISCCTDALRRRKTRPSESMDALMEAGYDPKDDAPQPDAAVLASENRQAVRQALTQLPEDMRAALVMSAVEGRSYEEIAQIAGVAVGTIKSRINRARTKLSELLSENREQSAASSVKSSKRRDHR